MGQDEKLGECPCCEHDATLIPKALPNSTRFFVKCDNDGCGLQTNVFATKAGAISTWNRRPTPSAVDVEADHISDARQMVPAAMPDVVEIDRIITGLGRGEVEAQGKAMDLLARMKASALSPTAAQGDRMKWRDPKTWADYDSKDDMVLLLVGYSAEDAANPTDDALIAWTIGSNNDHNVPADEAQGWFMAGWSWCQDCFTSGSGKVIGWSPLPVSLRALPTGAQGDRT